MKITTKTTKAELAAELARKQEFIERLQDNLHHIASQLVERTAELGKVRRDRDDWKRTAQLWSETAGEDAQELAELQQRSYRILATFCAVSFFAGIAATLLGVGVMDWSKFDVAFQAFDQGFKKLDQAFATMPNAEMKQGWQCPKCRKVWGPTVPGCFTCNAPNPPTDGP